MKRSLIYRVFRFYVDGFRNLPSWGRSVWIIILIKLFVMFVILKLFLMPDFLNRKFDTKEERGKYILEQLTE